MASSTKVKDSAAAALLAIEEALNLRAAGEASGPAQANMASSTKVKDSAAAALLAIEEALNLRAAGEASGPVQANPATASEALDKGNDDLSEEDWLKLECLSLKDEASRLSDSLDKTLEYIKTRCDVITGAA